MFALMLGAILVMTALVVDGGNLFQKRQSLQNAADASALAAAQQLADPTGSCQGSASVAGCAGVYAGLNGAKNADGITTTTQLPTCGASVTETKPPPDPPGCYVYPYTPPGASSNAYVEVWLTQKAHNFFGGLFGSVFKTTTESARSVGAVTSGNPPPISFAALDSTCENHTLLIKSSGNLTVDSGIYVNSCSGHDAFDVFTGTPGIPGSIKAPKIVTTGGWEVDKGTGVYVGTFPTPPQCVLTAGQTGGGKVQVNPPTTGTGCPITGDTATQCSGVGVPVAVCDPFATFPPVPTLGAGNVGAPVSVVKVSRGLNGDAANVARVVTASPHGLVVGDKVSISGVGTFGNCDFDGTYTVASVPNGSPTTFTYNNGTGCSNVPVIIQKQLSGGVATLTTNAPTTLNVGESDLSVSLIPALNINNPPGATVTGTGATSFSYKPPTFAVGINKKQLQSGTATLTLSPATAGLDPGDTVNISGVGPPFDGQGITVASVAADNSTFTYSNSATTSATSTLTVTAKAAAHGIATLTAANGLIPGDTITVNTGDPRFDGTSGTTYTVAANPAPTATQFSYVDSNLGTMLIVPTKTQMMNGVATITVPNNLTTVDSVSNVSVGNVNYDGGPFPVSHVTGTTSFDYLPAEPVGVDSGSVGTVNGKVAVTLTTSVPHGLATNDTVTVSGGDEVYRTGAAVPITKTGANTFTYAPSQLTGVSFHVVNATSATLTTPGTHHTNITSIKVSGTGMAKLDGTYSTTGANPTLVVTTTGFSLTGSGFGTGHDNTNGKVDVLATMGTTTFTSASETAVNIAAVTLGGSPKVRVPYYLPTTACGNSCGTVTAPGYVPQTTFSPPAALGTATLTGIPVPLDASGTFTPAWMPALFGITAKDLAGSAGIPSPDVITSGTVTLSPGTYYGGICIGVATGQNCGNGGANCTAAGGSTTTIQSYAPPVHLTANIPDNFDPTGTGQISVDDSGPIQKNDVIAIEDEEMLVTGVPDSTTVNVTREQNGTEDGPHPSGAEVKVVITAPNGTAYTPAKKLTADMTASQTTATLNDVTQIAVGDIIQIGTEAMTVSAPLPAGMSKVLNVIRGSLNTTPVAHAKDSPGAPAPVLRISNASAPAPPSVTLQKGVYIMAGGGLSVCGSASLNTPDGVMIYNTNDTAVPTGNGALGQVNINTAGNVHIRPMSDGIYAGMTIFQDRSLALSSMACPHATSSQWDIALQNAAPLPSSGELGSVSGTIYAPFAHATLGDTMSGTSNLAVITSCFYLDGATSTFTHSTSVGPLFGVGATLGG